MNGSVFVTLTISMHAWASEWTEPYQSLAGLITLHVHAALCGLVALALFLFFHAVPSFCINNYDSFSARPLALIRAHGTNFSSRPI